MSATNKTHQARGRNYIRDLLRNSVCADCGYNNWIALQFDHREPKNKSFSICDHLTKSLSTLKSEIDKCDIVCANCHIIRTANMFGSWRLTD